MTPWDSPPRPHRRTFLRSLAILAAGLGAAWWVRDRWLFPRPTIAFQGGGPSSGWIALPARGGLIELLAQVQGRWIHVVVDTGAEFSAIDRGLAAKLGLDPSPIPMMAFGVSGKPSLTHTVAMDLQLGPMRIAGLHAAALDLVRLSGMTRAPFSMLLGRDALAELVIDADWPAGRVAFWTPEAWRPPAGAKAAPSRSLAGALIVQGSVEGSAPFDLMVDTGATAELALSRQTAMDSGLMDGRPMAAGRSVSLGGVSHDGVVRAAYANVAGGRVEDVEVQIFMPAQNAPLPAGLLGSGFLRHYRAGIDLGSGRLWLAGPALEGRRTHMVADERV
jgi:predicted aspartyl protease